MRVILNMSKDFKHFLMWPQYLKSSCCSQSTMTLCTQYVLLLSLFLFETIIICFARKLLLKLLTAAKWYAIFLHTVYGFVCQLGNWIIDHFVHPFICLVTCSKTVLSQKLSCILQCLVQLSSASSRSPQHSYTV